MGGTVDALLISAEYGGDTAEERVDLDNVSLRAGPCNGADLAEPFGILNASDLNAFVAAFLAGGGRADLAEPAGVLNASDVNAFVAGFLGGCP